MTITEIIQQRPAGIAGSPSDNHVLAALRQEQAVYPFFPLPYFAGALATGSREDLHQAALYAPQRHLLKAWMNGQLPEMAAPRPATGSRIAAALHAANVYPAVSGEPFAILHFESPQVRTISPVLSIAPAQPLSFFQPYLNSLLHIKRAKHARLLTGIRREMAAYAQQIATQTLDKQTATVQELPAATVVEQIVPPAAQTVQAPAKRKIRRAGADQLLDQFLEVNPTIGKSYSPYVQVSTPESVQRSVEDDPTLVSETLARIYERQGQLSEAIEVYQKLCLLFPKKQAYFEAKIQQLTTV